MKRGFLVGLVGLGIAIAYVVRVLAANQMDPTVFLALGEESPIQTEYARSLLGDVTVRDHLGHDGKYFFAQANDPWYLEPETHAAVLDRPIYRGQRMLYPLLAGGFGLLPPAAVVWALIGVNVFAIGLGTLVTAGIATDRGSNRWWGLAFALNPGVLGELDIGGGGALGLALGLLGVLLILGGRNGWGAVALSGAALAREVLLGMTVGLTFGLWIRSRRLRVGLVLFPLAAMAIWNVYLRIRVASVPGVGDTREIAGFPFQGLIRAWPEWTQDPIRLVMGLTVVAVLIAFTIRTLLDRGILAWAASPFVLLATLLSVHVWLQPMDIFRGISPVLTAYALLVAPRADRAIQRNESEVEHVFD